MLWVSMRIVYSVVTDLARFRGKSTSTPFMIARSGMSYVINTLLLNLRYERSCKGMTLIRP